MTLDWTYRLRLRHLQMLSKLAETGNMSRTAQALSLTQPALSRWLHELEQDIGLPLFERHARGLRPTAYGEALIAHARRVLALLDGARDDMQALREGSSGLLTVGASGAATTETVPRAVARLTRMMPGARIRLIEGTMNVLMPQLGEGHLDVVVGRSAPDLMDASMRSETLYDEDIDLIVRPGHPLLRAKRLTWHRLIGARWLLWPRGTPIRNALDHALAEAAVALPPDSLESNSLTLNTSLLGQTDLIGQASRRTARWLHAMNLARALPLALSRFGSVSMYWRADAVERRVVSEMLQSLRSSERSGAPERSP